MESVLSLEQAKKVIVTKECVTDGKQPEILDADGKPIAVQAESAK
jgi:Ni,Fe-hydrogenase III component G